MRFTEIVCLFLAIALVLYSLSSFEKSLPKSVVLYDPVMTETVKALREVGASDKDVSKLTNGVVLASKVTDISPTMIVVLMKTESGFDENAKSSKSYVGLMQTKNKSGYNDVDILHGAKVLKEKLRYANGDMRHALALYKGGNNPMAKRLADHVWNLYHKVKRNIERSA